MNQELRKRIRPRNGESSEIGGEEAPFLFESKDTALDAANNDAKSAQNRRVCFILSISLHILAISTIIYGSVLRIPFHSGVECEMTYSMRHFVEISHRVPSHPVYRLYKFTDLRDTRQSHLHPTNNKEKYKESSTTTSSEWCTLPRNDTTTIVLYIPGHWGSFSQARSLGAHGLQWTRQREQVKHQVQLLSSGHWNGKSPQLSRFVYDVYAIDFSEQGGALHASFLYAQSDYVAQVILALVNHCHANNIILVGHSMGGLVAKSIPLLHPETRPYISHLITLASPHAGLLFSLDASLHQFYNLLLLKQQQQPNPYLSVISISGGIRDEMMPPEACRVDDGKNEDEHHVSILASDIADPPSRQHFGMDHRAIVWCHNVLVRVRQILHVLATSNPDDSIFAKLNGVLLPTTIRDYDEALVAQRESFRQQFGWLQATAMESAMLYRAELLLGLYAVTAGLYHAVPTISVNVVPLIVCGLGWACSGVNGWIVLVLSFVANAIHVLTRFAFKWLVSRPSSVLQMSGTSVIKRHVMLFGLSFLLLQACALTWGYIRTNSIMFLDLLSAMFVATAFSLPLVAVSLSEPSNVTFASLLLPIWPFLVVGKLFLIAWSIVQDFDHGSGILEFLLVVCLPVYLRMILSCKVRQSRVVQCAYLLVIAVFVAMPQVSMLRMGRGYIVGYFLSAMAWIDVLSALVFGG